MLSKNLKPKVFFCFFIVIYFCIVWHYSVDIPYGDDYDGILLAVTNMAQAKNYRDFLTSLFSTHNDGRLVVTYGLSYLQYVLSGHLNFKWLILLGNLFRVGIFFLVYYASPKKNYVFSIILLLFIFQFKDWENVTWAMSCLPVYSVIFFVFLSLFLLHRSLQKDLLPKHENLIFTGACISSVLAVFAYGNGVFVCFLGLLMLLWNKSCKKLLIYFIVILVALCLYTYCYPRSDEYPVFSINTIFYVLTFIGGFVRSHPFSPAVGLIGLIWGLNYVINLQRQNKLKADTYFYYLLFIGMSAFTAAAYRLADQSNTIAQALESRYCIYSILFFSILLSWKNIENKILKYMLYMIMVSVFIINSPQGLREMKSRMILLENYHPHNSGFTGLIFPTSKVANDILMKAKLAGVFNLPITSKN
jgi:hypothetical protein